MVADSEVHRVREGLGDRHLVGPVGMRSPSVEQPRHLDGPTQAIVGDGTERLEPPIDIGDQLLTAPHLDHTREGSEPVEGGVVDRGPEDSELRGARLGLHAFERRVASTGTGDRRQEDRAAERDDQRRRHETAPVPPAVRGRAHPGGRELSAGHRRRHLTGRAKQMGRPGAMVATRSLRWCWHHSGRRAPGPGARRTGSPRDLASTCTHQSRPKRFASAASFVNHVGSSRLPVHYTGTPAPGARPGQFERGPEAGRSEFLGSVTGRLRGQPVALGTPSW